MENLLAQAADKAAYTLRNELLREGHYDPARTCSRCEAADKAWRAAMAVRRHEGLDALSKAADALAWAAEYRAVEFDGPYGVAPTVHNARLSAARLGALETLAARIGMLERAYNARLL